MSPRLVSLVTPCYNEEESLPTYFQRVEELRVDLSARDVDLEVVLVDDGSSDRTWSLLETHSRANANINIVRHDRNGGFGKALQTGLGRANGDTVVTVDADSNYDLREAVQMLDFIDDGADVVTASPFVKGAEWDYPAHRYVLSKSLVLLYRLVLGPKVQPLSVYTCGFRAYRRSALAYAMPSANDFVATAEMIVRSLCAGLEVVEMPSTVHDRDHGISKMNKMKTTVRHLQFLRRILFSGIRGKSCDDSTTFPII